MVKSYYQSSDKANAEDIFQEGVSIAYVNLMEGKFQGKSSFTSYLIGICKNLISSERRRKKLTFEEISPETPEITEEQIVEISKVDEALNLVSKDCKELLKLYFYEKKNFSELVIKFNLSNEQVVRTKKYRCLRNLMTKINERGLTFNSFLQ